MGVIACSLLVNRCLYTHTASELLICCLNILQLDDYKEKCKREVSNNKSSMEFASLVLFHYKVVI